MASKFYGAIGISGGSDGYLDYIDGTSLVDVDGAVVIGSSNNCGLYSLDADSAQAQAIPTCMTPDANAGNKRWILQGLVSVGMKMYEALTTKVLSFTGTSGNWLIDNETDGGTVTIQGENSGNSTMIALDPAGAATLYHAGSAKLATAAGGITVTGDVGSTSMDTTAANEWTKSQNATINWDASANQVCRVTLGGNRTMAAPTNLKQGGTYVLTVIQDGTGSRTLSWNAVFKWEAGSAPTLASGISERTVIVFLSDGTNLYGTPQWTEN
jgi:hypothetical protein